MICQMKMLVLLKFCVRLFSSANFPEIVQIIFATMLVYNEGAACSKQEKQREIEIVKEKYFPFFCNRLFVVSQIPPDDDLNKSKVVKGFPEKKI